ncbi:2-(1,2-epoxy-1,2-dihydrophenyl)acetyl-CoA isomerase PaaG [Roseivivax sediminis]|uniref:Enoyl-CoA hydratase n=1 Tax=Roseivivax sediminis TaxID=936889 RepID=A0A1I2CFX7_9RHOB|nr:2-(1,2-epoxy-1,2-dihydrophenyl)acetyl-CoA isomerase PaaG [Roseivivax sediminis]SFE67025.1 Enoyl-CoA hydratase [Roseivivax sediminis]
MDDPDGVPVLTRLEGGVLEITLNRPETLNAFNEAMHLGLRAAFDRANVEPEIRAVLLTGAGRAFSSGQDLGDRDPRNWTEPPNLGRTLETFYNPLMRRIRGLDKPVVAAVNGVAAGAGANIALACDIVLAARSARFIEAFAKVGLVPDAGGTWMLPHLIGEARAKAIALTGEPVGAEDAAAWGMIWKAVEDDALMEEARALAARLAGGPTLGLGMTKRLIQGAAQRDFDTQLDAERDSQAKAGRSADYAEGVTAFLEKRAPRFQGK